MAARMKRKPCRTANCDATSPSKPSSTRKVSLVNIGNNVRATHLECGKRMYDASSPFVRDGGWSSYSCCSLGRGNQPKLVKTIRRPRAPFRTAAGYSGSWSFPSGVDMGVIFQHAGRWPWGLSTLTHQGCKSSSRSPNKASHEFGTKPPNITQGHKLLQKAGPPKARGTRPP